MISQFLNFDRSDRKKPANYFCVELHIYTESEPSASKEKFNKIQNYPLLSNFHLLSIFHFVYSICEAFSFTNSFGNIIIL